MRKNRLLFLMVLPFLFIPSKSFGKTLNFTSKEDIEIKKLKKEIQLLENKISQLEEIKKNRLIKNKKNLKIGLALSGGGAKGLAHIGVLRVLEELGIHPDYIAGTSMGAVVGALYSAGYSLDQIESILTKNDWDSFINGSFIDDKVPLEKKVNNKKYMLSIRYDNKFNFSLPKGFGNNQMIYFELKKLLSNVDNINNFDELPIPMRIITTDLNTGEAVAMKEGDLAKVITASIAIPTVFDPVEIDGRLYIDGLVSRNFPVVDVIDMGADIVIGSDVGNEIKDKKDYNIISVLNQLVAIQSASSTSEQRKLTSILITPDVLEYSATDLEKGKLFVEKGEEAARKQLPLLKDLPKVKRENYLTSSEKDSSKNIVIKNIEYKNSISEKNRSIINSILENILNREISAEELESSMMKVYGNDIINRIYYEIQDNTLVIDADINPNNSFGVSVNYLTGYGTTFDVGTTLTNFGKIGSNTLVDFQVGDYLGLNLKNFAYYGYSNKIGIFTNLGYNENPFFIYDGDKKISDSLVKSVDFEIGLLTQYNNQLTASYGIKNSYSKLLQETGSIYPEDIEYSKNYNGAFFRTTFDTLDSNTHANSGVKLDFEYSWEGSFDKSNSNFYGPLYSFDGYVPINKKFTFNYGLYGGVISGDGVTSIDKFIRLGGTKNNMHNKDFAFYGYRYQQKLVDEFLIGKLALIYKLDSNLYLSARWNIGTYSDLETESYPNSKKIWEDYSQGFDISITYESIFGPFEFSLARNNEKEKILSQISIGYIFE